jgi:predicted AlkP superfamily pyrophosphatase or phosphodiesterase
VDPVRPDYEGPSVVGLIPALLGGDNPGWLPPAVEGASAVFLLLLDGLGWNTLEENRPRLPNLFGLEGRVITTAVPSSTASALTSVTTGLTPAEHGIVGYRMRVGPEIFNVLAWLIPGGRPPEIDQIQPHPGFLGKQVPALTRAEFLKSPFSHAHMRGARMIGWRATSTLLEHCRRLAASGETFVYVYYDGIDVVAHGYGLTSGFFEAELIAADRLVGELLDVLPEEVALVVASDHGQVHVGRKGWLGLEPLEHLISAYGGDGRFRFLYAKPGAEAELTEAATDLWGERAWVFSKMRLIEEGWLGPTPEPWVADRIGDVVLAARDDVAFIDPTNLREVNLIAGHGSITPDEMLVPLLGGRGRLRHET